MVAPLGHAVVVEDDPYAHVLAVLPPGIFEVAARVAVTRMKEEIDYTYRVLPIRGGTFRNLAGGQYEGTAKRRAYLHHTRPILHDQHGRAIYPAILVPDLTEGLTDMRPVGFCGPTGFLGSIYGPIDDFWPDRMDEARKRPAGRFWATLVALSVEPHGVGAGGILGPGYSDVRNRASETEVP